MARVCTHNGWGLGRFRGLLHRVGYFEDTLLGTGLRGSQSEPAHAGDAFVYTSTDQNQIMASLPTTPVYAD